MTGVCDCCGSPTETRAQQTRPIVVDGKRKYTHVCLGCVTLDHPFACRAKARDGILMTTRG